MKKTKLEKGITLVALIITIVVLLILAVVSIGAVRDSGIIGHATNTSDTWKQAQANETTLLAGHETELNKYASSESLNPDYSALNLGDSIYYDSNLDGEKEEWIVYSINEDKTSIEIISANTMGSLTLGYDDPYLPESVGDLSRNEIAEENEDKAIWSYNNAIETINKYCKSIITATDNSGVRSVGATIEQDTVGIKYHDALMGVDTYGEKTITYLTELNCLSSKDTTNYWIASRGLYQYGGSHYCVFQYGESYDDGFDKFDNMSQIIYTVLGMFGDGYVGGGSETAGVRPIVLNPINFSLVK